MTRRLTLSSILLATVLAVILLVVYVRLKALDADRIFTPSEEEIILKNLHDKPSANFRILAYEAVGDSRAYGGQLEKILVKAGWSSKGSVKFLATGAEVPQTGLTIMTDGLSEESERSARHLAAALRTAKVKDVALVFQKNLPDPLASNWVFIKIGRKASQ
jgi:hypothetical protein